MPGTQDPFLSPCSSRDAPKVTCRATDIPVRTPCNPPLHQLTHLPRGSVLIKASPVPAPLLPSALAALFIVGDYAAEGQLGVMPSPSGSLMVPTACWISNSVRAVEAPHCGPKIPAHMVFPRHLGLIHTMASVTVPVS